MQTIRIGAIKDEPYAFSCFTGYPNHCRQVGIDLELIYTVLVDILNLTVTWVKYNSYFELDDALKNDSIDLRGNTGVLKRTSEETIFTTPPVFITELVFS